MLISSAFYCTKTRIVVELDGVRAKEMEGINLTILRICNLDIDRNFSGVYEYIDLAVKKSLPPELC